MSRTTTRRWSDNDSRFGPFVWSKDNFKKWGAVLNSGVDESPGCHLRVYLGTRTLLMDLPPIIRPWRQWIDTSPYSWSTGPGYWDKHKTEYGFQVSEGFLQVFFGPQTDDSSTERSWYYFLPWTEWEFVRLSLYDLNGKLFWTQPKGQKGQESWDKFNELQAARDICPTVTFQFRDFDDELIQATAHIEEREWHFGTGAFRWLRWFRAPRISRDLDLKFSSEVGRRKGSWKGGTVGHGIEMQPGELPKAAFLRYCAQYNLTLEPSAEGGTEGTS